MSQQIDRLRALLDDAENVVVLSHVRPDGDAVGSLLALALSLEERGKKVVPLLFDGVPARFQFLPGAGRIAQEMPSELDLLITVDCADLQRAGLSAQSEQPRRYACDRHELYAHAANDAPLKSNTNATAATMDATVKIGPVLVLARTGKPR